LGELLSFPATAEAREPTWLPAPVAKPIEPADLFLTYGTLMRGQGRHSLLAREEFVGEAYVRPAQLFDTGCGFPALFLGGEGTVWGEVYRILHADTWLRLDQIEGGLYHRVARRVHMPGRVPTLRTPLAQFYVGNPAIWDPKALVRIKDGRWENHATT
jgi:gamma-glutamylcyclotransferase (GGCT)/AIG2-like uncharacterized protein YtfP